MTNDESSAVSHSNPIIFYFVGEEIEVTLETLTGAQIKEAIRTAGKAIEPSHTLIMEGHGAEPDCTVSDDQPVNLRHREGEEPKHFHCRPNADFGG